MLERQTGIRLCLAVGFGALRYRCCTSSHSLAKIILTYSVPYSARSIRSRNPISLISPSRSQGVGLRRPSRTRSMRSKCVRFCHSHPAILLSSDSRSCMLPGICTFVCDEVYDKGFHRDYRCTDISRPYRHGRARHHTWESWACPSSRRQDWC